MTKINRRQMLTNAFALGALSQTSLAADLLHQISAANSPLPDAKILALINERISARQSLGMAIGVIERSQRRIVTAGRRGKSDSRPIDGNTVFGIASVTKPFVGLLLADSVLRGELKYEANASSYLPGLRLPQHRGREISVLDLATHTSGLPHELPTEIATDAAALGRERAKSLLYAYLASHQLANDPGTTWSYSNLDYALLVDVLERSTGLDYATLLKTRVTDPLEMPSTAPELSAAMRERRASPHLPSLEPSPEWNKPWMGTVLHSTANDLLTFLAACIGEKRTSLSRAFSSMLEIQRAAPTLNAQQASGWYIYPFGGHPVIGHSGGGGGFASTVMFDPHAHTGVVLLSNAVVLQEDLALHVLRESSPLNPIRTEHALDPASLDAYVGDYRDEAGAIAGIRREANGLLLLMPAGHKAPLTAENPTSFFVRGYEGLTVLFEASANGKYLRMRWTLNGKPTNTQRTEATN